MSDQRAAWGVSGLAVTAAGVSWALLYQLLRQYGRLSVRLDKLDERLAAAGLSDLAAPPEPEGVSVGSALPPFRLPDLDDRMVASEDFKGKRMLLVHWSPGCSFCDMVAPELADAVGRLRARNTELVLVSTGDADSHRRLAREYGLDCPILLQDESRSVEAFANVGTPAAYLIDEEGRVATGLVLGADKVPETLEEALQGRSRLPSERPLSESRLERDGIMPGSPAPAVDLPALDGTPVSLADHLGERVVLIFSAPDCAPCDELGPQLAGLHPEAADAGIALVMVGRGNVDENRRKRDAHGIRFPVVVQPGWRLSKQFGIFATPVAFAIDEGGRIAREVAKGPDEIVALIRDEIVSRKEAPMAVR